MPEIHSQRDFSVGGMQINEAVYRTVNTPCLNKAELRSQLKV